MELLLNFPFIPNRSKRVHNYYDSNTINPFTRFVRAEHINNTIVFDYVYFQKVQKCKKHCLLAYCLNMEEIMNPWRVLEWVYLLPTLYPFYQHPPWWSDFLLHFKDKRFDKNITNNTTGLNKLINTVSTVVTLLLDSIGENKLIANKSTKFVSMIDRDRTEMWMNCKKLIHHFINACEDRCQCNDWTQFSGLYLKKIKHVYPIVPKHIVETLNLVKINHLLGYTMEQFYSDCDYHLSHPATRAVKIPYKKINVPWDLVKESIRKQILFKHIKYESDLDFQIVQYFTLSGKDKTVEEKSKYQDPNDPPSILLRIQPQNNFCFVCDCLLIPPCRVTKTFIHDGHSDICELDLTYHNVNFSLIQRCSRCQVRYNKFNNLNDMIWARHSKWMLFYNGRLDPGSVLSTMIIDVQTIIILLYQQLRSLV